MAAWVPTFQVCRPYPMTISSCARVSIAPSMCSLIQLMASSPGKPEASFTRQATKVPVRPLPGVTVNCDVPPRAQLLQRLLDSHRKVPPRRDAAIGDGQRNHHEPLPIVETPEVTFGVQ